MAKKEILFPQDLAYKREMFKRLEISPESQYKFNTLPDYKTHSLRVTRLATKTGEKLNLPIKNHKSLQRAALFHDIGKLDFKPWIFEHEGNFTSEDRKKYLNPHVKHSKAVMENLNEFSPQEIKSAYHHHEKLDGSGYLQGLTEDQLSRETKTLTSCDIFEAITADRTYQGPKTYEKTKEIMISNVEKNKIDKDITLTVMESGKELLAADMVQQAKVQGYRLKSNDINKLVEVYDETLTASEDLSKILKKKGVDYEMVKENEVKVVGANDKEKAVNLKRQLNETKKEYKNTKNRLEKIDKYLAEINSFKKLQSNIKDTCKDGENDIHQVRTEDGQLRTNPNKDDIGKSSETDKTKEEKLMETNEEKLSKSKEEQFRKERKQLANKAAALKQKIVKMHTMLKKVADPIQDSKTMDSPMPKR